MLFARQLEISLLVLLVPFFSNFTSACSFFSFPSWRLPLLALSPSLYVSVCLCLSHSLCVCVFVSFSFHLISHLSRLCPRPFSFPPVLLKLFLDHRFDLISPSFQLSGVFAKNVSILTQILFLYPSLFQVTENALSVIRTSDRVLWCEFAMSAITARTKAAA